MKWLLGVMALFLVVGWLMPSEGDDAPAPSAESASVAPTKSATVESSPSLGPAEEPSATPTPAAPVSESVKRSAALVALAALALKGRAPMTGYDRDRFGQAWLDADRNGCDTRNDVLAEHLTDIVLKAGSCRVLSGKYDDPYTGERIDYVYGNGHLIDIDHVVPMGNSWTTGAAKWEIRKRAAFANDPLNLLPAEAWANRQKSDSDAASWLPPNKAFRCAYVSRQIAVKKKYGLWVTASEKAAMERVLSTCPGQQLTRDTWHAPTLVDHNITDPGAPGQRKPKTSGHSGPKTLMGTTYYENCTAVRAAGADPIRRGDPGYASHLDRDGDGVGCE